MPATSVSADVSANGTFQATGKRVEETKANGIVRFENLDFLNSNTVPAGSIVGTNAGVRFRTNGTVTVPKADIQGLSLFPGRISVKITAVKAGEDGNVDPEHDRGRPWRRRPDRTEGHEPDCDERRHARGVPAGHPAGR